MSDQNNWPDSDEDNHSERNQLGYVSRLCPVSISITEETRDANGQRVSSFHVHVKNRQRSEAPRFTAKVTLLSLWLMAARGMGFIRGLLAVVVRAAIVGVPWVVRIIIRRVVSVIFRLGGVNPISGVVSIGAAAKQKGESHGADERKDRYNRPTLFPFSSHAFGASFDGTPFANAS